jgi:hypothetical protein
MSIKLVCVFQMTLLQDVYKVCCVFNISHLQMSTKCVCVPRESSAGCSHTVFVYYIWLSCRMSTKCVCAFHMILQQDVQVCLHVCIPLDYLAGFYKVCLFVLYDSPAGYPGSVFMCSMWLSYRTFLKKTCAISMTPTTNSHHFLMQNSPTVLWRGHVVFSVRSHMDVYI